MTSALRNWWEVREPRERVLLSVLALVATLFALVVLLLLPLQSARAEADAGLERARAELAIVARVAPGLASGAPSARTPFDRSALISVSRAHGIRLTRVQPAADGSFAVWIDDAQTASLYAFFEDLLSRHAVTMERAVVSADANGRLSAQFTLR